MSLEQLLRTIVREEVRAALAESGDSRRKSEPTVTIEQAAKVLNCSRGSIYRLLARDSLRSIHVGRSRRVLGASLDQFLACDAAVEEPERAARTARRLRAVGERK